jgi:RNA polymerase sigma-70 factor, ECF subfamily
MAVVMTGPDTERDEAFRTYVVPELDVLFRVAFSMTRNRADAEDLVQDTVVRAYRALDRFDGRYPRAWLLTILRNTHINRLRRRRPELLDDPAAFVERAQRDDDGADEPEHVVLDSRFEGEVEAALDALPAKFRDVIELVDVRMYSYQEAADELGIPIGTVMSRLHRARKRMREHLAKAGFERRRF